MIERSDVQRLARLARLQLEPDEVDRLTKELRSILGHMAVMHELDLTGVPVFDAVAGAVGPLRADEPGADRLLHEPAALAPVWRDGFFTVPRLDTHGGADDGARKSRA